MKNTRELKHPLVQHHVTLLRDKNTPPDTFRQLVRRLAVLLTYEATADLKLTQHSVQTPLVRTEGSRLKERIALVPILRAGLGMVDPVLDLIPTAEVRHLGFYRDEESLSPVEYYKKFPDGDPADIALVLDPMLATGGSAEAALEAVHDWGVRKSRLLCIIAAPEGIRHVRKRFPDTEIFCCAVDERLNEQAYILPGLGDAGDRLFNTPVQ